MIANFHTHTVFCDGNHTPEEIVLSAIAKGFSAIGFSGHGYTGFDLSYCMKDICGYIAEINRLKETYKKEIQVYLGAEEDAFSPVDRGRFDYIIGSSHYVCIQDQYYAIDSDHDGFRKCLAAFDDDVIRLAQAYYRSFCDYIKVRKPDIIGHFDLITKFDELDSPLFLNNHEYNTIAGEYIAEAAQNGCIFEINTGAMARGLRTAPYPSENLLYILRKLDAPVMLSSDSHGKDTLDFGFEEAKKQLRDIGFTQLVTIDNGEFVKYNI